MSILFDGVYQNPAVPWWGQSIGNPANIEVSTITVNAEPAGNILLTSVLSSTTEFNAPLIFQRPALDPNAPSESLVMNLSDDVPTKLSNGSYITATKASGTAYDDIAVEGIQIYGNQTTSGNSGAHAYITGEGGNLILAPKNSVMVSSLQVSSLQVVNVISTTAGVANSYKANLWMSTPILVSDSISTSQISTNTIRAVTANISTINVSTLNAPNFTVSTVSSLIVDTKVTLTSTLSLTGSPTNINLGLGDVIQGLVGGAATQALGVGIGSAALVTGSVALVTGRTSGGVNSNVFQTVNGSTQLQFSTIGSAVSSIFLTVNSPNPLTTPGLEIQQSQGVAAGTYCVRSVGDPLYINNNVSSIQMYGQWVPVIQPTATIPGLAISSLNVSSINNATYPPPGGGGIPSTLAASTITINGNQTQSGTGTFNWGGNTMSPTQVVLARPTSVNNTLTTTGGVFLNAGATVNSGLIVSSGGLSVSGFASLNSGASVSGAGLTVVSGGLNVNSGSVTLQGNTQIASFLTVFGQMAAQAGLQVNGGNAQFNGPTIATNTLSVAGLATLSGGTRTPFISTTNISTANVNLSSINGAAYPPGGGGSIPSTLQVSTLTVNGGQTITNGALIVTSGGISVVTDGINVGSGNVLIQDAISVNGLATLNGGVRASAISTNTISTNSLVSLSGQISSFIVSSINNAPYPPASFSVPSTLFVSTISASGKVEVANGLQVNNAGAYINNGPLQVLNGGNNRIDGELNVTNGLVRTQAISTVYISSQTITASNVGCFQVSTITASALTCVVGGGSGGNLGLVYSDTGTQYGYTRSIGASITTFLDPSSVGLNIQNGYTYGANPILRCYGSNSASPGTAQFFSTLTVCNNPATNPVEANIQTYNPATAPNPTGTMISKAVSTLSINVSSINGFQIPQSLGVPTGMITLWGGTSEGDPPGFYICDGRLLNVSANPALYAVIGDSYYNNYPTAVVPGTFYLPDLTFAIPQGAPKANYNASFVAVGNYQPTPGLVNIMQNVPGVPPAETANRVWKIYSMRAGTINVGTLIPGGQYIGVGGIPQTANLYIQSIVQTDPTTGNPLFIAVESVDGSTVATIPQGNTVNITCTGVYRQPTPPLIQNFWAAGTFNELAFTNPGSNGPTTEAPSKRNVRTQQGVEVGVHTHTYIKYGQFGSTGLVNGNEEPSKGNYSPQTGNPTQNITDALGNTWAAPYPTKPNVINMFYIIKN